MIPAKQVSVQCSSLCALPCGSPPALLKPYIYATADQYLLFTGVCDPLQHNIHQRGHMCDIDVGSRQLAVHVL